ncbi:conserved hypothetical protein [Mesorhizobium sp. SOD10]|nr:conserved hypothetical protein [Mesorhizobium sp. SOD10]
MTNRELKLSGPELKAPLLSDADGFRRVLKSVVQEVLETEMTEGWELRRASGPQSGSITDPATTNAGL